MVVPTWVFYLSETEGQYVISDRYSAIRYADNMAPAVRAWETDAAPQVGGHIYVVTHSPKRDVTRKRWLHVLGEQNTNLVLPQLKKVFLERAYALKIDVEKYTIRFWDFNF